MRIDLYTKTILTVIALALTLIACKSLVQPSDVAAQGSLAGAQFIAVGRGFWAIDTRGGDIWEYPYTGGDPTHIGKISQLGKPLVK